VCVCVVCVCGVCVYVCVWCVYVRVRGVFLSFVCVVCVCVCVCGLCVCVYMCKTIYRRGEKIRMYEDFQIAVWMHRSECKVHKHYGLSAVKCHLVSAFDPFTSLPDIQYIPVIMIGNLP